MRSKSNTHGRAAPVKKAGFLHLRCILNSQLTLLSLLGVDFHLNGNLLRNFRFFSLQRTANAWNISVIQNARETRKNFLSRTLWDRNFEKIRVSRTRSKSNTWKILPKIPLSRTFDLSGRPLYSGFTLIEVRLPAVDPHTKCSHELL